MSTANNLYVKPDGSSVLVSDRTKAIIDALAEQGPISGRALYEYLPPDVQATLEPGSIAMYLSRLRRTGVAERTGYATYQIIPTTQENTK